MNYYDLTVSTNMNNRHLWQIKILEAVLKLPAKQHCTVVYTVMKIWLEILGVFGTKICYFIRKNIAENGPLEFRTVLCSNLCQMLVFDEKKR